MSPNSFRQESAPAPGQRDRVLMIGPFGPHGGGMYKVADYTLQANARSRRGVELEMRDVSGEGRAASMVAGVARGIAHLVALRLRHRRLLVHLHVSQNASLLRKGLLVHAANLLRVPTVMHLHGSMLAERYRTMSPVARAWTRTIFRGATSCVTLGPFARRFLRDELGVPPTRLTTIANGTPSNRRAPAARADGRFNVLFLGHLCERKGVADLVDAMAQLPADLRWHLDLVGDGERDALQARAASLGIADRIAMPGWASAEAVAELLAKADVLVLPSRAEALPLVVIEALGAGVPVVCTAVGELPHYLRDREHVLFVQPNAPDQIARAVAEVAGSPELCARLVVNGLRIHERQFSLDSYYHALSQLYARCLPAVDRRREHRAHRGLAPSASGHDTSISA